METDEQIAKAIASLDIQISEISGRLKGLRRHRDLLLSRKRQIDDESLVSTPHNPNTCPVCSGKQSPEALKGRRLWKYNWDHRDREMLNAFTAGDSLRSIASRFKLSTGRAGYLIDRRKELDRRYSPEKAKGPLDGNPDSGGS